MIDINKIRIDGGTQARVELDKATVAEYRNAFLAGAEFPPVTVFDDGTDLWLCDGFHRMAGALAAGHTALDAEVQPGTQRDAVLHSLKVNATHGLRRSSADKRKAVGTLLADDEWARWGNREIARAADVSESLVRHLRENADAPTERVVRRKGTTYRQDVTRIGKVPGAPAPVAATDASGAPEGSTAFRALLSLPPITPSASTGLMVPELPPKTAVTGDKEVDAVLWLQRVVDSGDQSLIDKALEAIKRIKMPMKELADRYAAHIVRSGGHPMEAVFATMGFGELEDRGRAAVEKARHRHEAMSRFGSVDALFADSPAEAACKEALDGLEVVPENYFEFNEKQAAERFSARPELSPSTLEDCLHAMDFWGALYTLRSAAGDCGDPDQAGKAHDDYAFAALARIPPRATAEAMAMAVFDYLDEHDAMDRDETKNILRSLIRGPRE